MRSEIIAIKAILSYPWKKKLQLELFYAICGKKNCN